MNTLDNQGKPFETHRCNLILKRLQRGAEPTQVLPISGHGTALEQVFGTRTQS